MKTLYNKLHIFGQTMLLVFFTLSVISLGYCSKETVEGLQIFYPKSGWIE